MDIIVTGSTGLIGSALVPYLKEQGHRVTRMVRSRDAPAPDEVQWNPSAGILDPGSIEGRQAVVHLAGENVAGRRWTPEVKRRILESRVGGTQLLSGTLSRLSSPPSVLISASAIGYYGNRGDDLLREESPPGRGFFPEVVRAWEGATQPAAEKGIRVINLRTGVVLSRSGGALASMLPLFRAGLGGRIGSGKQFMSWISLDDLLAVIHFGIQCETLGGPVNAVAPQAVTNSEFTRTLGRALSRPTLLPVPALALRLALGEMANELLLASTRVAPARLLAAGYRFRHPGLEEALRRALEP